MLDFFKNCSGYLLEHWSAILIVFPVFSLLSFSLYGIDKWKARHHKWRISEKALLLSAFFFGGIGAFWGMKVFHHKTQHWYFRLLVPLFMVLQLAFLAFILLFGLFF